MTNREKVEKIYPFTEKSITAILCEKINEVFNGEFPCFCGANKMGVNHPIPNNLQDIEKLTNVLDTIDLLK